MIIILSSAWTVVEVYFDRYCKLAKASSNILILTAAARMKNITIVTHFLQGPACSNEPSEKETTEARQKLLANVTALPRSRPRCRPAVADRLFEFYIYLSY